MYIIIDYLEDKIFIFNYVWEKFKFNVLEVELGFLYDKNYLYVYIICMWLLLNWIWVF